MKSLMKVGKSKRPFMAAKYSIMERYKDEGTSQYYYWKEILVHCPNCNEKANINNPVFSAGIPVLQCSNCHYSKERKAETFILKINVNCPNCGIKIENRIGNIKEKKSKVSIKCKNCSETNSFKPRYVEEYEEFDTANGVIEPVFGCELWYWSRFKGESFWATNSEHLNDIKNYVKAKVRVRSGKDYTTMVEKLPKWISNKKNRDAILKLINKLELK